MEKKHILIPALSGLLVSTSILAAHISADEITVGPSVATTTTLTVNTSASVAKVGTVSQDTNTTGTLATPAADSAATSTTGATSVDATAGTSATGVTKVDTTATGTPVDNTATSAVDTTATATPVVGATSTPASTTEVATFGATPAGDATTKAAVASSSDVTILHTNDVHGRFEESSDVIGSAKLATIAEETRAKGTTLLLDSGDAFQGLAISNSTKGEEMAAIMNQVGYDAMTVGNHEFDFGFDQLMKLKGMLNFPIISSNIYVNGARVFQPSTIIDKDTTIKGDEFVVIGVTTPETYTKTHPDNIVGVTFTDPVTELNNVIAQVEANALAEGKVYKNYIILAHLGVDATTPIEWRGSTVAEALSKNTLLAGKNVVFLDGHSHTVLSTTYGSTTYNQAGSYLNNLGYITLNSTRILSNNVITKADVANVKPDATVAAMVASATTAYEAQSSNVIVKSSPVELNGDRTNVRVRETNLGDAVADALFEYGQTGFTHKTDLAVTNGGGLRTTIAKGEPITNSDVVSVLPFGNSIAQIEVTGQNIYDMFVKSLSSILQVDKNGNCILDENGQPLLEPSGGYLQVSGAKAYYDTTLSASNRILNIDVIDPSTGIYHPLDLMATYYLATNDFLSAGGDGYTMLGGPREEGPSMDTIFASYLSHANLLQYAIINPNSRVISVDSTADTDGDGYLDYIEMVAGTSLTNASDYPGKVIEDNMPTTTSSPKLTVTSSGEATGKPVLQMASVNVRTAIPVTYNTTTSKEKNLPMTGSRESMLAIIIGLSMTSYGLYGIRRRKPYGK